MKRLIIAILLLVFLLACTNTVELERQTYEGLETAVIVPPRAVEVNTPTGAAVIITKDSEPTLQKEVEDPFITRLKEMPRANLEARLLKNPRNNNVIKEVAQAGAVELLLPIEFSLEQVNDNEPDIIVDNEERARTIAPELLDKSAEIIYRKPHAQGVKLIVQKYTEVLPIVKIIGKKVDTEVKRKESYRSNQYYKRDTIGIVDGKEKVVRSVYWWGPDYYLELSVPRGGEELVSKIIHDYLKAYPSAIDVWPEDEPERDIPIVPCVDDVDCCTTDIDCVWKKAKTTCCEQSWVPMPLEQKVPEVIQSGGCSLPCITSPPRRGTTCIREFGTLKKRCKAVEPVLK
jgi:hypothetical protein